MRAFVAAFVVALLVAAGVTPIVRRLAFRIGAIDLPGGRRIHKHGIPRLGGVGIYLGFLAPLVGLFYVESSVAAALRGDIWRVVGVLVGGLAMCALGFIDDVRGIRALYKLYAHIAAATFAFACGYRIDAIGLPLIGNLSMGVFAFPITVLWIVGIINAVNLIDGLDGLAAGVVFFAGLTNFVVAYLTGSVFVAILMAAMMGAVLGFLFYNFNPARIFMGDSGSYFLGYVLATTSLAGSAQKASTTVSLLVPVIALGVPIFDTLFAMVRRFLERRSLFSADRGHLHHRLLDIGLTQRRAVLIIYGISVLFTAAAIAVSLGRNWQIGVAILGAAVVVIGLVRFVGAFEYTHLRRRQRARIRSPRTEAMRRVLPAMISSCERASTATEVMAVLTDAAGRAGLEFLEVLDVRGRSEKCSFRWDRNGPPDDPGKVVSARYPLGTGQDAQHEIKFGWQSDQSDVSPQLEILLQVLVDAACEGLIRTGSEFVRTPRPADVARAPVATAAEPDVRPQL